MAGKNDCGMAGNGWRETDGGKRVAGNSWREHMAGKGCAEYVIVFKKNQGIVREKNGGMHQSAHSRPTEPSRPTAGRLDPVGQLQADWT